MTRTQQNLSILIVALALAAMIGKVGQTAGQTSPVEVSGLYVAILEETAARNTLPLEINGVLASTLTRTTTLELGGQYRQIDAVDDEGNPVDLSRDDPVWTSMLAARGDQALPVLVISNHPHGGYVGPVPATLDETLEKIREVAGGD